MEAEDIMLLLQNVQTILTVPLLNPDDCDSDSDDEEFPTFLFKAEVSFRVVGQRRRVARNEGFVDLVMDPDYPNVQFKSHFRMSVETFHDLENRIGQAISRQSHTGRCTLEPRTQILAALWIFGTPDSYRSVSERFALSKSLVHDSVRRVVRALTSIAPEIIVWPKNEHLQTTKMKFTRKGMRDAIGAVDGTYIPIKAPEVNTIAYRTRKANFAIVTQAVCDADMHFIDIFAGYPGGVGDARIFRNSDIFHDCMQNEAEFFPNGEYILGDKAYPCLPWVIPPYKSNIRGGLTQSHHNFNHQLSRCRVIIERAFALLKGRFRRLKYLDMSRVDEIPAFVLACCVLHNLCLRGFPEDNADVDRFINDGEENEGDDSGEDDNDGGEAPNAPPGRQPRLDNVTRARVVTRWGQEGEAKREHLRLNLGF